MARRIESHFLPGPAGRLEALLEEPEGGTSGVRTRPGDPPAYQSPGSPRLCAVVCHPHPLYGGTMHNKVVYRIARGLRRAGIVVLRFNFRGVGASEGVHANSIGEMEDARAALEWLRQRYPRSGYALAGFSFGARIITQLGCAAEEASFLMAAGFPTGSDGLDYLADCPAPKIFIQSTNDQYGPRASLEAAYAGFAEPKRLLWIEAQDHFFTGGLDELEEKVRAAAASI